MLTAFLRWLWQPGPTGGRDREPTGRDLACIGGPLDSLSLWLQRRETALAVWRVGGSYRVLPPGLPEPATLEPAVLVGRYVLVRDLESGTEWLQYRDTAAAAQVN